VNLPSQCPTNAIVNLNPWLTVTDGINYYLGTGTLNLHAEPNSFTQRQGSLTYAGKTITVTQAAGSCTATLSSTGGSFGSSGGTGAVSLTTSGPICKWIAHTSVPWIQLSSSNSTGTGAGTLPFLVAANPGTISRMGQISIGDQTYQVTQSAGPGGTSPINYSQTIIAGMESAGYSGDGGPANMAQLSFPSGMAFDSTSNLYVADTSNNRIRKIDTSDLITTVAGNGNIGFVGDGGQATAATINFPNAVAVDASGNLYIADTYNNRIRKLSAGIITTYAGTGTTAFNGDGPALQVNLNGPTGIAVDQAGNLYISDSANNRIRKVTPDGNLTTIAGSSSGFGGDNGPAFAALLHQPTAITVDSSGNLYVIDCGNLRIRKISTTGIITTVAGNGYTQDNGENVAAIFTGMFGPSGLAVDAAGAFYFGENDRIRKVTPDGFIHTISGSSSFLARGLAVDGSGNLYDAEVSQILKFTPSASFCTYQVTAPNSQPISGGTLSIPIFAGTGCPWSATSNASWITPNSTSGNGSASATFTVAPNPAGPRQAVVSVAGQNFTITQSGSGGSGGQSKPGLFRQGFLWFQDVDGNQQINVPPDRVFGLGGIPGDIPVTGDWNGSGTSKAGVFRPNYNGQWVLDWDGTGQNLRVYYMGGPGDLPVVGDWTGTGSTRIGIFHQGFLWILDSAGHGAIDSSNTVFPLGGIPGDIPLVGDWNGNGISKPGLFRQGFLWILDTNGDHQITSADAVFGYGGYPGDVPIVGDWAGTGITQVGIFRQGFLWVLDSNGNRQIDSGDVIFAMGGITGDKPIIGNW
jgi:sugar lactone lactonase YvrE